MSKSAIEFLPASRTFGVVSALVAIMVFLAGFAAAGGFAVYNVTADWSDELARNMTVQVVHADAAERRRQSEAAIDVLLSTPGIERAERLETDAITALLEPWLGEGNVSEDLPLPSLISVTLAPDASINHEALAAAIRQAAPDAALDDHQQWMGHLSDLADAVQGAAALAGLLIAFATAAIVVFATQARLAGHRETIDIIHLIGAEDRLIASEFRTHFGLVGLKGGLLGAAAAALGLLLLSFLARDLAGGFVPGLVLAPWQMLVLLGLPLLTALLAMLTADITVRRTLAQTL